MKEVELWFIRPLIYKSLNNIFNFHFSDPKGEFFEFSAKNSACPMLRNSDELFISRATSSRNYLLN